MKLRWNEERKCESCCGTLQKIQKRWLPSSHALIKVYMVEGCCSGSLTSCPNLNPIRGWVGNPVKSESVWQRYRVRDHIRALCDTLKGQSSISSVRWLAYAVQSGIDCGKSIDFYSSFLYIMVCFSSSVFDSWRSMASSEVHRSLSLLLWDWKIFTMSRFSGGTRTNSIYLKY